MGFFYLTEPMTGPAAEGASALPCAWRKKKGLGAPFLQAILSTKYCDSDLGLYYYGFRYMSPGMGRWLNRDPIGEWGADNRYVFLNNRVFTIDVLGLIDILFLIGNNTAHQEGPRENNAAIGQREPIVEESRVREYINLAIAEFNKQYNCVCSLDVKIVTPDYNNPMTLERLKEELKNAEAPHVVIVLHGLKNLEMTVNERGLRQHKDHGTGLYLVTDGKPRDPRLHMRQFLISDIFSDDAINKESVYHVTCCYAGALNFPKDGRKYRLAAENVNKKEYIGTAAAGFWMKLVKELCLQKHQKEQH